MRQCVVSVEPDEGIHVDEDRRKSRRNHESERQVMREISRGRKVPDETRDRANNQLDKGARERDPQFGGLALEGPRVGYVGVERRHEVDQHEPDLMNFTAISFAGQPVAIFVKHDYRKEHADEHHNVTEALVLK